jgi:hypothetical protein
VRLADEISDLLEVGQCRLVAVERRTGLASQEIDGRQSALGQRPAVYVIEALEQLERAPEVACRVGHPPGERERAE